MFTREIATFRFLMGYGETLLSDVSEEEMTAQPTPGMNHPAWILGHLTIAFDRHGEHVGLDREHPEWDAMFGMGSQPESDSGSYPAKEELLTTWKTAGRRFAAGVLTAEPQALATPTEGPLGEAFPTTADFLTFSLTSHTAIHLGQLSAWRKATGRPALF